MDSIWEAYTEKVDWEGYVVNTTQISLHRTKKGAEGALEDFAETYPSLGRSSGYNLVVRERKVLD